MIKKDVVYVLLADGDGTMHSSEEPFGVAVTTEAEAQKFQKEGKVGYTHSYQKIVIFDLKEDAIKFAFPNYGNKKKIYDARKDETINKKFSSQKEGIIYYLKKVRGQI